MNDRMRQATRLWTLAQPAVSAFITSVVRDFRDRDDVLQDVAVAVVESFDAYDPARPFTPWAIGVARNQVGLHLRRRRRDRHIFDTSALDHLATAFATIGTEEIRHLDHLRDCIARLDARGRRLCDLRYGDGLKPAAIAPLLGMSANAVAKAMQRVRDQLRDCIARKTGPAGA